MLDCVGFCKKKLKFVCKHSITSFISDVLISLGLLHGPTPLGMSQAESSCVLFGHLLLCSPHNLFSTSPKIQARWSRMPWVSRLLPLALFISRAKLAKTNSSAMKAPIPVFHPKVGFVCFRLRCFSYFFGMWRSTFGNSPTPLLLECLAPAVGHSPKYHNQQTQTIPLTNLKSPEAPKNTKVQCPLPTHLFQNVVPQQFASPQKVTTNTHRHVV